LWVKDNVPLPPLVPCQRRTSPVAQKVNMKIGVVVTLFIAFYCTNAALGSKKILIEKNSTML
jgi:hypothetical protein